MIDFHSHILPGIDDGSDSPETSLEMLVREREQGVELVCLTPHFYADYTTPERFFRHRAGAFDALRRAMDESGEAFPLLRLGAEVRFFDGISNASILDDLCLEGTNLLLLEMPFASWSDRMVSEVGELCRRGLQPVAAHIERYFGLASKKTMRRFLSLDILVQSNAEFFLSRRTSRKALRMLRDGQIHFLGSDAHNLTSRAPNLGGAWSLVSKQLGAGAIERLEDYESLVVAESEAFT